MKITTALHGVQRLYIETAPFIYFIESYPDYVDRMREVFTHANTGAIKIVTSSITLTEVLTKPMKSGDQALIRAYRAFLLNTRYVEVIPIDIITAQKAAEIRAQYNLKTPDALQVASAIISQCNALLTNDTGFKRAFENSQENSYWIKWVLQSNHQSQ